MQTLWQRSGRKVIPLAVKQLPVIKSGWLFSGFQTEFSESLNRFFSRFYSHDYFMSIPPQYLLVSRYLFDGKTKLHSCLPDLFKKLRVLVFYFLKSRGIFRIGHQQKNTGIFFFNPFGSSNRS